MSVTLKPYARGPIKVELIKIGIPVHDIAGYTDGDPHPVAIAPEWELRDYQCDAMRAFLLDGDPAGGSGVLVLPCGAGKTVIGLAILCRLGMKTLILTPSITAARQWRTELLNKTTTPEEAIAEYSGHKKNIAPITIATYQILTSRVRGAQEFAHMELFSRARWGLIIYDEVHLLPAPVFRATAEIQACRRLGLTGTLVREDNRESEVFSLIGPKRFDVPWKLLEHHGWIAKAKCIEVRVPLPPEEKEEYDLADSKAQFRLAATNSAKLEVVARLLKSFPRERILIIGLYLDQLESLGTHLDLPVIDGGTGQKRREQLFADFRSGKTPVLIVSKVGNVAIDLPDARIAIQVSGTFGSRQEEAQRLGRILRPKAGDNTALFFTLVTPRSEEQHFAARRGLFLAEQGYEYALLDAEELCNDTIVAVQERQLPA